MFEVSDVVSFPEDLFHFFSASSLLGVWPAVLSYVIAMRFGSIPQIICYIVVLKVLKLYNITV